MNDTIPPTAATDTASAPDASARHSEDLVERWWTDHFPGSPVGLLTAAWNHAFAAKEDLKRRLAGFRRGGLEEDN